MERLAPFAPECAQGRIGEVQVVIVRGLPGRESHLIPFLQAPAQYYFVLGVAGGLQENLERGDILIPTASIRGEGLTQYHAPPDIPAVIDLAVGCALREAANRLGVKTLTGLFHTTASMYREPEYVPKLKELGVIGIQMELAQFYLLAHLYGKRAGAVYVVTDSPAKGDRIWEEGMSRDKAVAEGVEKACDIVVEAIGILHKKACE